MSPLDTLEEQRNKFLMLQIKYRDEIALTNDPQLRLKYQREIENLDRQVAEVNKQIQTLKATTMVQGNINTGSGNQFNVGNIIGDLNQGNTYNINYYYGYLPDQTSPQPATVNEFPIAAKPLRIFLCHSGSNPVEVKNLYNLLNKSGYKAWLKEEDLLPGQNIKSTIKQEVSQSDLIIVLLTKDFAVKAGSFQSELNLALQTALEKPPNSIFIIPVRLEESTIPSNLSDLAYTDLFAPGGYETLAKTLQAVANKKSG